MNLLANLAPLFALLLLAIALKLYWPAINNRQKGTQFQEIHGRDPNLVIGHILSAIAMLVLIFSFTYHDNTHTTETSIAPAKRIPVPPRDVVAPAKQGTTPVQAKTYILQVVAMSNDKIAIIEDGNIITLKPGQQSPRGWKLISSTTLLAELIAPDGTNFTYHSPPPKE